MVGFRYCLCSMAFALTKAQSPAALRARSRDRALVRVSMALHSQYSCFMIVTPFAFCIHCMQNALQIVFDKTISLCSGELNAPRIILNIVTCGQVVS